MATALYLKIDGIDGESTKTKHEKWIEIDSFGWGANQPTSVGTGSGLGAGRVHLDDLHISSKMDSAFPDVFLHCCNGKHIPTIKLEGVKMGEKELTYLKIELNDCMVTHASISGQDQAEVTVSYSIQGSKVKNSYQVQQKDGSGGATVERGWDIKKNEKV